MTYVLDPYELKRENDKLKQENFMLKQWVSNLTALIEKMPLPPPPAIILKCTPEQLETARKMFAAVAPRQDDHIGQRVVHGDDERGVMFFGLPSVIVNALSPRKQRIVVT